MINIPDMKIVIVTNHFLHAQTRKERWIGEGLIKDANIVSSPKMFARISNGSRVAVLDFSAGNDRFNLCQIAREKIKQGEWQCAGLPDGEG